MIEFLSTWVKNLSLALIVISILEMILPNNKTKKYIKMVMGIYILFSIVAPFIENGNNFDLENVDISFYEKTSQQVSSDKVNQESMENRLNQIYKEELEKDITSKLEQKGYELEKCSVIAKISDESYNKNTIEKIVLKIKGKTLQNVSEDINSIENKIITEVEKIKKVEIKVSEQNEEKNNKEEPSTISKADIKLIKEFLIQEYGVSEKCLKIN